MQFIDLGRQFDRIEDDVRSGLDTVLQSKAFIMGAPVYELERELASFVAIKEAVSCASGTDALMIALMAYGIEEGDAIFVPTFTFFATAEAVSLAGGTPVFVDSDPDTFNIDPVSLEATIKRTILEGTLNPRGIITVDLFGLPAAYDVICNIAAAYGLFVLEDAAQGFGGIYKGKRAGNLGDIAATSFFPAKPLGCYGDGGALFIDDHTVAQLCKSIRNHGQGVDRYDNVRIGLNSRLDSFQAAVLLAKMKIFEDEIGARNTVAAAYTARLGDVIKTPFIPEGCSSAWAQYTLSAEDEVQRDTIRGHLEENGIPTMLYYPVPIHLSKAYRHLGYEEGALPVSESLSKRVLSIPMHPYLGEGEIEFVSDRVREALS